MWPSVAEIYHSIQGDVLLFSAMRSNVAYYIKSERDWGDVMAVALEYAEDIYISDADGEVIKLPYTVKNNKSELLAFLG